MGRAVLRVADQRRLAVEIAHAHVAGLEDDLPSVGQALRDQILHDLVLAVDRDGLPAGERGEVDAVALARKAQLDPMMQQALAQHALADAGLDEEIGTGLFQHAGADAFLHVLARARLHHDRGDAGEVQEVGQQQPRRTRAYDADLGSCHE